MSDSTAVASSSNSLDLNSLRSRIEELREIQRNSVEAQQICPSELEELINDCALELERKINQILFETSDINSLSYEDLGKFLDHLKKELIIVEDENAKVENEIEELSRGYMEDSSKLEYELEGLSCSLEFLESQGIQKEKWNSGADNSAPDEDGANSLHPRGYPTLEIMKLNHQMEKSKITLKTLQDLDCKLKRLEVVEKIEDAFSGLKVVEFEGNCIRLSLKTYIPSIEGNLALQNMEYLIEPLEQNHELLLELADGTMELKHVEIFPNDVYIGHIIDTAKSLRDFYSQLPMPENRSSLEWFVRRVQDRIVLSTLRRLVVKCANKSRHSFEYLDKDEIIIAHMVGGIDACVKVPQGWPMYSLALDLITLKSSSNNSNEISLSFICKVVELVNNLDSQSRQSLPSFADRVEEILRQQMRAEEKPDLIIHK